MEVKATDGKPARIYVEGQELGGTGEILRFDISRYRQPVELDIVLKRDDFAPSLHHLSVDMEAEVWRPAPLAVYPFLSKVILRTSPKKTTIFKELNNGELEPAGKDLSLIHI